MYKISKDPDGIVLLCHDCSHVERIDLFDEGGGNRRTQSSTSNAESLTRQAWLGIGLPSDSAERRAHGATRLS